MKIIITIEPNNKHLLVKLNESQVSEAYNLKVTIGELKFVGCNEAKTSKAKRIEVF
jgi:hypothetical protein